MALPDETSVDLTIDNDHTLCDRINDYICFYLKKNAFLSRNGSPKQRLIRGLKGNAVQIGNSSRCCKSRLRKRRCSPHWPLSASGREGAESGTSQKTCLCTIAPTTCGEMGWQHSRHHRSAVSYFPRNRTVRIHRYSFQWVVLNQFSKRNRTHDPLSLSQYHTFL